MTDLAEQHSPTLMGLPNELLHRIFEDCHISAHLNLFLTCRRLASCGSPFLEQHKAAYQEHGVVSDLEPLTIPLLLQKVLRDPYVAWNVRSIEIWATRNNWDAWGSIALEVPALVAARPLSLIPPEFRYYWDEIFQNRIDDPPQLTEEQLDVYLDLLREHAHFDEDDVDEARKEFSNGADFFYKILLVLLCPRLNSFKHVNINDPFIRRSRDSNEMFWWLSVIIPRSQDRQSWAPGLKSLREVALGIQPGLWFKTGKHRKMYPSGVFTSVMMLPNLKSVYFGEFNTVCGSWWSKNQTPTRYYGLSGSSSIEHIFLDNMWHNFPFYDVNQEFFSFLSAPTNPKSLTIGGDMGHVEQAEKYRGMLHLGRSLESLVEYSDGEISGLYKPFTMVPISERLSRMTIDIWSFVSKIFKPRWDITHSEMREDWRDSKLRVEIESRLAEAFPKTSEVLLFHKGRDMSRRNITINEEILEEILIQLVRCNEHYPALKAIGVQQQREDPDQRTFSDYRFLKLAEVCWQNGVDAYVRGNLCPLRHQLDMPMPPALSSSRGVEAQDAGTDRILDPFTGNWVEREVEETEIEG